MGIRADTLAEMDPMKPSLRSATAMERSFCEHLTRSNLQPYLAARNMTWEPDRYRASWEQFENLVIVSDDATVGVLRLLEVRPALEIRDLQLEAGFRGRGIGTWAIAQAQAMAVARGLDELRLRVFAENPARRLYARLGFQAVAVIDGSVHMTRAAAG